MHTPVNGFVLFVFLGELYLATQGGNVIPVKCSYQNHTGFIISAREAQSNKEGGQGYNTKNRHPTFF